MEFTRCHMFEISAYMSSTSHGLPKKSVLISPNEVVEAEDPGHKKLDESIPVLDAVPRGVADSHISPRSRGAACVFEPKGLTNGISEGQQVNVQRIT